MIKKKKICSLVYKLLTSICQNNQTNQEKISNYLPILAMQAPFIPGAFDCIISIIKDYEELLLTLHSENSKNSNPAKNEEDYIVYYNSLYKKVKV